MSSKVSDFLLQRLVDWGVRRVYAYLGDGINGILGAFGRIGDGIDFVRSPRAIRTPGRWCAPPSATWSRATCHTDDDDDVLARTVKIVGNRRSSRAF